MTKHVNSDEDIKLSRPHYVMRERFDIQYYDIVPEMAFDFRKFSSVYCLSLGYTPIPGTEGDDYIFTETAIDEFDMTRKDGQEYNGVSLDALFCGLQEYCCGNICIGIFDLTFYGPYILSWLLNHSFIAKHSIDGLLVNEFFAMINEQRRSLYYAVHISSALTVVFFDLRVLFNARRESDIFEAYEIDENLSDSAKLMQAVRELWKERHYKMSMSTNAITEFRSSIGYKTFTTFFDGGLTHPFARRAFYGGFCYTNERYRGEELRDLYGYDFNSMYPSVMLNCPLPYGEGIYMMGDVSKFVLPSMLYIQHILVSFTLMEDGVPCLFRDREDIDINVHPKTSGGEVKELWLTNFDMEMLFDNYYVISIKYIDGVAYPARKGYFDAYVMKYKKLKESETGAKRALAKSMLNILFGAFGRGVSTARSLPSFDEEGCLKFTYYDIPENEHPQSKRYCEVSAFVAAWARKILITDIKKHLETFVYCDTDSLYLTAPATDLPLSDTEFGNYKEDKHISRAIFLGTKRYIWEGEKDGQKYLCVACAGATPEVIKEMNFDNFKDGTVFYNNFQSVYIKGGKIKMRVPFRLTKDTL